MSDSDNLTFWIVIIGSAEPPAELIFDIYIFNLY